MERLSQIPIIAEIPKLERGDSELVKQDDISPVSEAFRILMTNMNYMLPKKQRGKVVFVLSLIHI